MFKFELPFVSHEDVTKIENGIHALSARQTSHFPSVKSKCLREFLYRLGIASS